MDKSKLEYLLSINRQLRDAIVSVESLERKDLDGKFLEMLNRLLDADMPDDIEAVIEKGEFDIPHLDFMLDGEPEFDKHPKMFLGQFQYIILIYASCVFDGDPRLDLHITETVFEAGRHFERLKSYGYRWSDGQSETGKHLKKTSPNDEQLISAYNKARDKQKNLLVKNELLRMVKSELKADNLEIGKTRYHERINELREKGRIT